MNCSVKFNEELGSDNNIRVLFIPTATCCCDTAVTSLYWRFTSSAGCRLRSWMPSCPTWTPPPFSPSVSLTSSSIILPTRSKCRAIKVSISALSKTNGHLLPPCRCSARWAKIHAAEFRKNRKTKQTSTDEQQQLVLPTASAVVQDQPLGYWKMVYFRSVAARDSNKWKRHLGTISNYTGLPSQTERILR